MKSVCCLAVLFATVGCSRGAQQKTTKSKENQKPKGPKEVRVLANGNVRVFGQEMSLEELKTNAKGLVDKFRISGEQEEKNEQATIHIGDRPKPGDPLVPIVAEPDAKYAQFKKVVKVFHDAGVGWCTLEANGLTHQFRTKGPEKAGLEQPPLIVAIKISSTESGSIDQLVFSGVLVKSLKALHQRMVYFVGPGSGPDARPWVVLDCDDRLLMKHVFAVYNAVSHKTLMNGARQKLAEQIQPLPYFSGEPLLLREPPVVEPLR